MSEPWLVVIDMQRIFRDDDNPWSTPGFDDVLPRIRRLIGHFGDRVVFTRFVAPEHPEGAWADYYREWSFALQPSDAPAYDIVDDLDVAGRPVVSRTCFGKWGPDLAAATDSAGELVVAGVSTECCVLTTVLGAADAGVRVTVAADACAGPTPELRQCALDVMASYAPLVILRDTTQVLERYDRSTP